MLNLKEFKTMNKQVNDYYYLFNIEAKDKSTVCPMLYVLVEMLKML